MSDDATKTINNFEAWFNSMNLIKKAEAVQAIREYQDQRNQRPSFYAGLDQAAEIVKDVSEVKCGRALYCENCQFFLENWKCMTWHMFVRPDGYCFRAERKPDEEETV